MAKKHSTSAARVAKSHLSIKQVHAKMRDINSLSADYQENISSLAHAIRELVPANSVLRNLAGQIQEQAILWGNDVDVFIEECGALEEGGPRRDETAGSVRSAAGA